MGENSPTGTESETERLASLLSEWREPGALVRVPPILVVPDATNREHTQLSVEHIHYIASKMEKGFQSRKPGSTEGHDIPVLVRGHPDDPLAVSALRNWEKRAADHAGFPKPDPGLFPGGQWFCSLGNSHFFGALNLFRTNWTSIFTGRRYAISPNDPALRQAVHSGVESVVLRWDTPRAARKEISLLLNKCHDAKWAISETGEVVLFADAKEYDQFEALSKVCDADELGALLRIKLGINEADADSGYRDTLVAASIGPEGLAVGADGAAAAAEAGGTGGASAASEHREDELSVSVRAGGGAGEEEAGERGKGAAARQQIQRSATSAAAGSRRESRCTLGEMVAGKEHQSSRRGLPPLPPAAGVAAAMPRSRL